jgi:hypothetical protein
LGDGRTGQDEERENKETRRSRRRAGIRRDICNELELFDGVSGTAGLDLWLQM